VITVELMGHEHTADAIRRIAADGRGGHNVDWER
jgi:hypothetical protein